MNKMQEFSVALLEKCKQKDPNVYMNVTVGGPSSFYVQLNNQIYFVNTNVPEWLVVIQ
jgi:hypothetical protein